MSRRDAEYLKMKGMVTWARAPCKWYQVVSILVLWPEAIPESVNPRPRDGLNGPIVSEIITLVTVGKNLWADGKPVSEDTCGSL